MRFIRQTCARLLVAAGVVATLTVAQWPMPADAAGALAVGKCGSYGFAYDYGRRDAARADALRKCNGGCKVVAEMQKNCGALAVDGRNVCGAYGFATARQLGPAQNTALRQCYQNGGKDCVIRAFVCDGKG
jgi:hypothetical protein